MLLAIDIGLRCGFALFGPDGRLREYRSRNYGSRGRFKRAAYGNLRDVGEDLEHIIAEGDRHLAEPYLKLAERRGISGRVIGAGVWRERLLLPRERSRAKHHADRLARAVIEVSGLSAPPTLRHDAAEAILIGLWGALEVGYLEALPEAVRRGR